MRRITIHKFLCSVFMLWSYFGFAQKEFTGLVIENCSINLTKHELVPIKIHDESKEKLEKSSSKSIVFNQVDSLYTKLIELDGGIARTPLPREKGMIKFTFQNDDRVKATLYTANTEESIDLLIELLEWLMKSDGLNSEMCLALNEFSIDLLNPTIFQRRIHEHAMDAFEALYIRRRNEGHFVQLAPSFKKSITCGTKEALGNSLLAFDSMAIPVGMNQMVRIVFKAGVENYSTAFYILYTKDKMVSSFPICNLRDSTFQVVSPEELIDSNHLLDVEEIHFELNARTTAPEWWILSKSEGGRVMSIFDA